MWEKAGGRGKERAITERRRLKDTRQVLNFLRDLYSLRERNAFTSHLVSSLPALIRAEAYTYNEMDQARGQASYKLWPDDFTPIKDAQEILGRFDFIERERTALNIIQPHVLQAYANAEAVTHMKAELARLHHAAEQISQGLVSVDGRGIIQWATARGRELLDKYFQARRKGLHRLPDLLIRWIRSIHGLEHADERPGGIGPMRIDQGARQLRVRMVPEVDHCLLFLEEDSAEVSVEQLAHLGLSRRETEILGWLVRGKSNPEIATILSLSVRTIHKHVGHIYLKLSVENRHAAIALVLAFSWEGSRTD